MSCSCSRATCCPSDVPSYPVRNLAFEAAQQAFDSDNCPDAPCQNDANEPLYEALMNKAESYHPEEEIYKADAYARAAHKIADLTVSAFDLTDAQQRRLGVGPKTNQFIYQWILANKEAPQKMVDLTNHLEQEFLSLQRHIQDLVKLTKDMPVYCQALESMDTLMSNLRVIEKSDQLLAAIRK
jgi:hypothetical protein